eukprot:5659588-Alexandrium_andersonii.AAC.1
MLVLLRATNRPQTSERLRFRLRGQGPSHAQHMYKGKCLNDERVRANARPAKMVIFDHGRAWWDVVGRVHRHPSPPTSGNADCAFA